VVFFRVSIGATIPNPQGARRTNFQFPAIDEARGFDAVEALEEMAKQKGATVAQVALAWLVGSARRNLDHHRRKQDVATGGQSETVELELSADEVEKIVSHHRATSDVSAVE